MAALQHFVNPQTADWQAYVEGPIAEEAANRARLLVLRNAPYNRPTGGGVCAGRGHQCGRGVAADRASCFGSAGSGHANCCPEPG